MKQKAETLSADSTAFSDTLKLKLKDEGYTGTVEVTSFEGKEKPAQEETTSGAARVMGSVLGALGAIAGFVLV